MPTFVVGMCMLVLSLVAAQDNMDAVQTKLDQGSAARQPEGSSTAGVKAVTWYEAPAAQSCIQVCQIFGKTCANDDDRSNSVSCDETHGDGRRLCACAGDTGAPATLNTGAPATLNFSAAVADALGDEHAKCAFGASGVCHSAKPSSFASAANGNIFIKTNGEVWVNGWMASMFAGQDDWELPYNVVPMRVSFEGAVKVCGGGFFYMILKRDGTLWVMGRNDKGQLGLPVSDDYVQTPTQMPGVTDVVDVQCGTKHAVFQKSDWTVWSVGDNKRGQLCLGDQDDRNSPVQITTSYDAGAGPPPYDSSAEGCTRATGCWPSDGPLSIHVEGDATCFLRKDGVPFCCGLLLGNSLSPKMVDKQNIIGAPSPPEQVGGIQLGIMGKNAYYLRDGVLYHSSYWREILTSVAKMWVSEKAAWFLKKDGTVYGTTVESGTLKYYATGFGDATIDPKVPKLLVIPTDQPDLIPAGACAEFFGGSLFSHCVTTKGLVYSAGANSYGSLGINAVSAHLVPHPQCESRSSCQCFLFNKNKEPYYLPMNGAGANGDWVKWVTPDGDTCTFGPSGETFSVVA